MDTHYALHLVGGIKYIWISCVSYVNGAGWAPLGILSPNLNLGGGWNQKMHKKKKIWVLKL